MLTKAIEFRRAFLCTGLVKESVYRFIYSQGIKNGALVFPERQFKIQGNLAGYIIFS